jgi:hypothetical protein
MSVDAREVRTHTSHARGRRAQRQGSAFWQTTKDEPREATAAAPNGCGGRLPAPWRFSNRPHIRQGGLHSVVRQFVLRA